MAIHTSVKSGHVLENHPHGPEHSLNFAGSRFWRNATPVLKSYGNTLIGPTSTPPCQCRPSQTPDLTCVPPQPNSRPDLRAAPAQLPTDLSQNTMAIHSSVQKSVRKRKKPAALKGLPRRSPTPVLPEPYATLCPSSDGIGCLQHSMAADNHHRGPQPPYGLGVILWQYTHRSFAWLHWRFFGAAAT